MDKTKKPVTGGGSALRVEHVRLMEKQLIERTLKLNAAMSLLNKTRRAILKGVDLYPVALEIAEMEDANNE